jgi:hypothetical protein
VGRKQVDWQAKYFEQLENTLIEHGKAIDGAVRTINTFKEDMAKELKALSVSVGELKVRASLWGGAAGVGGALVAILSLWAMAK